MTVCMLEVCYYVMCRVMLTFKLLVRENGSIKESKEESFTESILLTWTFESRSAK